MWSSTSQCPIGNTTAECLQTDNTLMSGNKVYYNKFTFPAFLVSIISHPPLLSLFRVCPSVCHSGEWPMPEQLNTSKEVTWLVITEVRSESFGLVTERRHYKACHIYASVCYVVNIIWVWYHAPSLHYACIRSSGIILIPHPLDYLCPKLSFFHDFHCSARTCRKIAYSLNQSINHLITHPAYLMRLEIFCAPCDRTMFFRPNFLVHGTVSPWMMELNGAPIRSNNSTNMPW